ncbi:3-oxoadipate enol-lactonase [Serratia sp. L9]|uniref:3-oxoadipate enol-lactonase n=1 Tax=Serratia sp. L9 TaxID=3423946 RepID=UPI003D67BDA8
MNIDYRLEGPADAPLLVLSNSLGTTFNLWQPQMAEMTRHFRVLRYNQRGHGHTPLPDTALTLEILGRDVIALLDSLDVEQAHFCGISMGGLTGLWLNRFQPQRLKRLVVANTAARIGNTEGWQQRAQLARSSGLGAIAAASAARWFSEDFQQRFPQQVSELVTRLAQSDAAGYAACCDALAQANLLAEIPQMSVPMLVIAGELDPVTTVEDAQTLLNGAPNARLAVLPASHISNITCPELFTRCVVDFLDV